MIPMLLSFVLKSMYFVFLQLLSMSCLLTYFKCIIPTKKLLLSSTKKGFHFFFNTKISKIPIQCHLSFNTFVRRCNKEEISYTLKINRFFLISKVFQEFKFMDTFFFFFHLNCFVNNLELIFRYVIFLFF
jgi:hypothetical protein